MRAGTVDRVKRQLMRDAVSDNLATIRGLPPRNVRPLRRAGNVWMQRLPLLLIPVTLLGSSYLISEPPVRSERRARSSARASVVPIAARSSPLADSFEPVTAAAFPLAVRRVILDAGHGRKDAGAP